MSEVEYFTQKLENGIILQIPVNLLNEMLQKGLDRGIKNFTIVAEHHVQKITQSLIEERAKELLLKNHKEKIEKEAIRIADMAVESMKYVQLKSKFGVE